MEVRRCMKCMHPLTAGETVCPECGRAYGSVNAETFALKPGTILEGKYLVGEMLGQGGLASPTSALTCCWSRRSLSRNTIP